MRLLKRAAISLLSIVVFLGAAEIAIEAFATIPEKPLPISFWGAHDDLDVAGSRASAFRPHFDYFWEPRPGGVFGGEALNEDGYRGRVFTKTKTARVRIITLGDSSTMGFRVSEAESWPRLLEAKLRAAGKDAEVINFGCVGYSAFQGDSLYQKRAQYYNPDLVIAAFGAINEAFPAERGIDQPEKARIMSTARFRARASLCRFTLYRWLENCMFPPAPERAPLAPKPHVSPEQYIQSLAAIAARQRERGGKFMVVCPPRTRLAEMNYPNVIEYTGALHRFCDAGGFAVASVYERFREREPEHHDKKAPPPPDPWYHDWVHPTAEGHAVWAEIVYEQIAARKLVD